MGAVLCAAGLLLVQNGRSEEEPRTPAYVVGVYGVGGVIGEDGTLWQYMPDRKKWLDIDEAFRSEGQEKQILPLPVRAEEIQFMESWGFLVTREGVCWHYDLQANRWENVGSPKAPGG
jgi:hypothetical protein